MYVEVPAWRLCFSKNFEKGVGCTEFPKRDVIGEWGGDFVV